MNPAKYHYYIIQQFKVASNGKFFKIIEQINKTISKYLFVLIFASHNIKLHYFSS